MGLSVWQSFGSQLNIEVKMNIMDVKVIFFIVCKVTLKMIKLITPSQFVI